MCCGHIQMPFWHFFGGTFLGKACVKAPGQAVFFLVLFTKQTMEAAVDITVSLLGMLGGLRFCGGDAAACSEILRKVRRLQL